MNDTPFPQMGSMEQHEYYYDSIETIVDEIEREVEDLPEAEQHDVLVERVWESVDGSEFIIYFSYNIPVLNISTNEPHEWKHLVADGDDYREVLQAMAYKVMEQDVWDEIRERDLA